MIHICCCICIWICICTCIYKKKTIKKVGTEQPHTTGVCVNLSKVFPDNVQEFAGYGGFRRQTPEIILRKCFHLSCRWGGGGKRFTSFHWSPSVFIDKCLTMMVMIKTWRWWRIKKHWLSDVQSHGIRAKYTVSLSWCCKDWTLMIWWWPYDLDVLCSSWSCHVIISITITIFFFFFPAPPPSHQCKSAFDIPPPHDDQ